MKFGPTTGVVLALLVTASASPALVAQSTEGSHNPAVKSSAPHTVAAPARGSNSFTQSQARGRLSKAGYLHITKLMKDQSGAWTGSATKGGKHVSVALDYKGNITTR